MTRSADRAAIDRGLAAAVAVVLSAGPAGAADAGLFTPAGPIAEAQSAHFLRVALIALIAIVPALIATPLVLWRSRLGNRRAVYDPDWGFNRWYEIAIWSGPVVIVLVLAYWLVDATRALDPYRPLPGDALRIDLVGLDWKWLALYPGEGVAAVNEIVVPVDRPVAFRLTADTVMQSFLPLGFAGQIYLMPGMVTELHLKADAEREGLAEQTQYSGDGFANQRVRLRSVSGERFADWVGTATGDALDALSYPQLAESGGSDREIGATPTDLRPLGDTCLFERIVARYHQGAPIPPAAQPGSPSYRPDAGGLPQGECGEINALRGGMPHGRPE